MQKTSASLMTPAHPQWDEFLNRLFGEEGIQFRDTDDGNADWDCDDSPQLPLTRALLHQYPGIDIDRSAAWLLENIGPCDCQIVFYVAPEEEAALNAGDLR